MDPQSLSEVVPGPPEQDKYQTITCCWVYATQELQFRDGDLGGGPIEGSSRVLVYLIDISRFLENVQCPLVPL